jgi:hypothetical protein
MLSKPSDGSAARAATRSYRHQPLIAAAGANEREAI